MSAAEHASEASSAELVNDVNEQTEKPVAQFLHPDSWFRILVHSAIIKSRNRTQIG